MIADKLPPKAHRIVLSLVLLFTLTMIGVWGYNAIYFIYESWLYKEMSTGIVKYPIWIPQLGMGVGVVLFFLAILEDLLNVVTGKEPNFEKNKEQMAQD
jgi:TRAP-type C4-dicarboxylate transport system permease small subunit